MAKRFTDTEKWKKPWYRKLSVHAKLVWAYILDNCDHCGVWAADFELLSFQIGIEITKENLEQWFGDKVENFEDDKYFIPGFVEFQYGVLRDQSPAHRAVIALLKRHGIQIDHQTGLADSASAIAKRLSGKFKLQLLAEDYFRCTYCGMPGNEDNLCIDHIVPKSKGGDNNPYNLTTACLSCNQRKSDLPVELFIQRLGEQKNLSERLKLKLNTLFKGLNTPNNKSAGVKEKDKEEDKDQEEEKESKGTSSDDARDPEIGAIIDQALENAESPDYRDGTAAVARGITNKIKADRAAGRIA